MKLLVSVFLSSVLSIGFFGQSPAQKIYETERAFEKMVAEKGINAGFVEFLATDGIMFFPEAANGREKWKARPALPAALTWNPIWIDVSSNGALGYSIGNSIYRPKGKDDKDAYYGHYISIWSRQPNGEYRAALDTGINHEKPASMPTEWKSPAASGKSVDAKGSAGDHAANFFSIVESQGAQRAYQSFLADDAFLMRDGKQPFVGKKASVDHLKTEKPRINFAKRQAFLESGDLAYVNSTYSMLDKSGAETERGNYVQVWKMRSGKWQIAADVFIPIPKK